MFHAKIERQAVDTVDSVSTEPRAWWQTRAAALLFILAAAIPLLYPSMPPLVDLPGHMARYRVELDLHHSPDLQRYFTFDWALIGNLGVDLLIIPLGKLFGLELATKLIALTIPALTVAGFLAVAKAVHRRVPPTALFALPLAYSQPMNFGFLNYTLSMALALLAFAAWLKLTAQGRLRSRALIFTPLSVLLFFVHAYGWAFFCVLAFTSELVRARPTPKAWLAPIAIAVRNCLPLAVPVAIMAFWRAGSQIPTFLHWSPLNVKAFWLIGIFRYNSRAIEMALAFLFFCAFPILVVRLKAKPSRFHARDRRFAPRRIPRAALGGLRLRLRRHAPRALCRGDRDPLVRRIQRNAAHRQPHRDCRLHSLRGLAGGAHGSVRRDR